MTPELPESAFPEADDILDSLLSESMQQKADAQRLKDGRKLLKSGKNLATADLDDLLKDMKRIELQQEWRPVADVAMFSIQTCECCGNVAAMFLGIFQRQYARGQQKVDRWVAASTAENRGLPKEIHNQDTTTRFCCFCIEQQGYPIDQLDITFEEEETVEDVLADIEAEIVAQEAQTPSGELQDLADDMATAPHITPEMQVKWQAVPTMPLTFPDGSPIEQQGGAA